MTLIKVLDYTYNCIILLRFLLHVVVTSAKEIMFSSLFV